MTALEKLQGENKNALLQPAIDEAVRRAKIEQAHYQAQFDKLVADNTDLNTGTDGVQSFKTMYDEVRKAMTKRDNAGVTLETAVQTREAATRSRADRLHESAEFLPAVGGPASVREE